MSTERTYTDPSVYEAAARGESWADPVADPTLIDWAERQRVAVIPFRVVDGRPVRPGPSTGIQRGRGHLGHWGEQAAADAIVIIRTRPGSIGWPWLLMVERGDGLGWALPGGYQDADEDAVTTALRELAEETGLTVGREQVLRTWSPRLIDDPRGTDEAWIVSTPVVIHLGHGHERLPCVEGRDDARRAAWLCAVEMAALERHLDHQYGGRVWAAHRDLIERTIEGLDQ